MWPFSSRREKVDLNAALQAELQEERDYWEKQKLSVTERILIYWIAMTAVLTSLGLLVPAVLYSDHKVGTIKNDNFWTTLQSSIAPPLDTIIFCLTVRRNLVKPGYRWWLFVPSVLSIIGAALAAPLHLYVSKDAGTIIATCSAVIYTFTVPSVAFLINRNPKRRAQGRNGNAIPLVRGR